LLAYEPQAIFLVHNPLAGNRASRSLVKYWRHEHARAQAAVPDVPAVFARTCEHAMDKAVFSAAAAAAAAGAVL